MKANRTLLLPMLISLALGGCDTLARYRHMPAGYDDTLWRPEGAVAADLDLQAARRTDLVAGSFATAIDAKPSSDAVDRLRRGRVAALPESSISHIGQSGGGGAAPAGGQ